MPVYRWIYHPIRSKPWLPSCCVCNAPVPLERSKTDEYGQAIHEECYVLKVCSKVEFLSPANGRVIHQPFNAAMTETLESPISGQRIVFAIRALQPSKRTYQSKRPWNVDLTAVVTVLVSTCWTAYSNRRPNSPWKFSELQSIAFDEQASSRHANAVGGKGTPDLQTMSLPMKEARGRTRLRRIRRDGTEYVKEDVTVRYLPHTLPRRPASIAESEVAYIGSDVTVRYFSTEAAGVPGTRTVGRMEPTGSRRGRP